MANRSVQWLAAEAQRMDRAAAGPADDADHATVDTILGKPVDE